MCIRDRNKATQLSADTKTLILSVEGMTCAACAARIERVLDKEESCKTQLSIYNKREHCFNHAPVKYPRVRGRILQETA